MLHVDPGEFTNSEIIVLLGENGTGKTTFVRMLAGLLKSDEQVKFEEEGLDYEASQAGVPELNVSYKPQKISPKFQGTVRQLLHKRVREAYVHPQFISDVMKPLVMDNIIDNGVQDLSGGELQRLAIVLALGTPADVYLIDEPSAYLDSEQRVNCAKVIKRFIMHSKKTAFVVEHDFIMATYLADRVVVYHGQPGVEATASSPQSLLSGMNQFLKSLEVTFRRDPVNYRPRYVTGRVWFAAGMTKKPSLCLLAFARAPFWCWCCELKTYVLISNQWWSPAGCLRLCKHQLTLFAESTRRTRRRMWNRRRVATISSTTMVPTTTMMTLTTMISKHYPMGRSSWSTTTYTYHLVTDEDELHQDFLSV